VVLYFGQGVIPLESFGEKLKKLRGDMSQDELANVLDMTKASISKYENDLREPRMSTAKKIANYFGVDFNWLIGFSEDTKLQEELHLYNVIPRGRTVQIPLLGRIPAGIPVDSVEIVEGYIDTPETQVKDGQYFYLRVVGDSMIGSRIYEGDLVLVKKQCDVESGEIAVVRVNSHDATLKRVKKLNNQVILFPDNPKYEPIIIHEEGAEIVGKVVKVEFDPNKKY
jgi:repressor LexA